ncbi:nitroreductase family protein [Bradyrhizobium sp. CB1015]|uniref:nitroreductase family protein n=1 Tax=Bradyrhizobium sp. CB1015 TaxID=2976822 RepID=UPI003906B06C
MPEFCNAPVPRRTIEQILRIARFAPSGANIQPRHVYVLAGAAKDRVSMALLDAHENSRDEHVSEYKYYASDLLDPYLKRQQEFGRLFYESLGIAQIVSRRGADKPRRTAHILRRAGGIDRDHRDRRLEVGSWLDLGMFVQNVMLAAAGRGLQSCAGNVRKIPSNFAPVAVNSGGADGDVRYIGRTLQGKSRGLKYKAENIIHGWLPRFSSAGVMPHMRAPDAISGLRPLLHPSVCRLEGGRCRPAPIRCRPPQRCR